MKRLTANWINMNAIPLQPSIGGVAFIHGDTHVSRFETLSQAETTDTATNYDHVKWSERHCKAPLSYEQKR